MNNIVTFSPSEFATLLTLSEDFRGVVARQVANGELIFSSSPNPKSLLEEIKALVEHDPMNKLGDISRLRRRIRGNIRLLAYFKPEEVFAGGHQSEASLGIAALKNFVEKHFTYN